MATPVTIRGHGTGTLLRRDSGRVTVDCGCRLLPGRPYVVQGLASEADACRMRVATAWVQRLRGEAGVTYRVTFDAEPDHRYRVVSARQATKLTGRKYPFFGR